MMTGHVIIVTVFLVLLPGHRPAATGHFGVLRVRVVLDVADAVDGVEAHVAVVLGRLGELVVVDLRKEVRRGSRLYWLKRGNVS